MSYWVRDSRTHRHRATGHINWCHSNQDLQPVDPKQPEETSWKKKLAFFFPYALQPSDLSQENRRSEQETSTKDTKEPTTIPNTTRELLRTQQEFLQEQLCEDLKELIQDHAKSQDNTHRQVTHNK